MALVVALDAGTGGAKCAVYDLDGNRRALTSATWEYRVSVDPEVALVRTYSFDPEHFWSVLCRLLRRTLAEIGAESDEIIAVAATSQREGCVFLDGAGKEIYAGPNLDARGFMEGLEVLSALGPELLYRITGHGAPFIFPLARYLWFRKHGKGEVARILMINDWMTYRLCGRPSAEPSNATESMLFDFQARGWSDEILARFEIPAAVLPPVHASGERIGSVSAAAAEATGLAEGTPVFTGGADTQCALLGAAAIEPGDTALILGTTGPLQQVLAEPTLDPSGNLWAGCHVVPDRWVLEANLGSTGDAYRWLLDLVLSEDGDRYARAERLAREHSVDGSLSYIGPRIFDLTKLRPDMPGGIFFRFPMLQLRPSRGDLLRAFLESIAFAARGNLELIGPVTGHCPERLSVAGGMARNEFLVQLLADVTGLSVRSAAEPESASLGVAILAATGAERHPDISTAVERMCRWRTTQPDARQRTCYDDAFSKWREIYDQLDRISV
jgi:sugar (pentulose or hexulose) kinase